MFLKALDLPGFECSQAQNSSRWVEIRWNLSYWNGTNWSVAVEDQQYSLIMRYLGRSYLTPWEMQRFLLFKVTLSPPYEGKCSTLKLLQVPYFGTVYQTDQMLSPQFACYSPLNLMKSIRNSWYDANFCPKITTIDMSIPITQSFHGVDKYHPVCGMGKQEKLD